MIVPYKAEHPDEEPDIPEDEVIMRDDVTAQEKLDEIKRQRGITE